jgi:hypothetical protein
MATAPEAEAEQAQRNALELEESFKERHKEMDLCPMPPVGVIFMSAEGQITTTLFSSFSAGFDWSKALPLTNELEMLAEEAREWWPRPDEATPSEGKRPLLARLIQLVLKPVARAQRADAERRPHSFAAFSLLTWLLKAIVDESGRRGDDTEAPPSPIFEARLAQVKREIVLARTRLAQAMQRSAQTRYWYGALLGSVSLTGICAVLALIFAVTGTPAFYGVALATGGVGAMVSLLQRMSTGRLKLDTSASRDLLELFGGVRPLIGAIFGIIVAAAIQGGLLPAIKIPTGQQLAFFTVIGFLAGFNERWAQDMLKSSGDSLRPVPGGAGDALPAPAAGLGATD